MNKNFWLKKKVFITGHSGFKGSWLTQSLLELGADVCGYSLEAPTQPNLFSILNLSRNTHSLIKDVRNLEDLKSEILNFKPDIAIHLAAQSLVKKGYQNPIETYSTNVMGTVNFLEALRSSSTTKAALIVTSDKCYENNDSLKNFTENNPMGGFDPYSNSKGCAELITSCYRSSYFSNNQIAIASARAGNVIGGGDWAADRLIPDIIRSFINNEQVLIRRPNAIRPWQHVLEPISGYLELCEKLFTDGSFYAEGWNLGPNENDSWPVKDIVEYICSKWGKGSSWKLDERTHEHEAKVLTLNTSKANSKLKWFPKWSIEIALNETINWYKVFQDDNDKIAAFTNNQIKSYFQINSSKA